MDLEQAAKLFEKASEINPQDYQAPALLAQVYSGLGQDEKAESVSRRALRAAEKHLELLPEDGRALYLGAIAMIRLGEAERGREWANRAVAAEPEEPLVLYNAACAYALPGDVDTAIDALDEAITFGLWDQDWLVNDHDLNSLRNHPRFLALLDRL